MILEFPNLKEEENDTTNSVIDKKIKKEEFSHLDLMIKIPVF